MFLLVPAYPGSPGQKAVKRLCVCVVMAMQRTGINGESTSSHRGRLKNRSWTYLFAAARKMTLNDISFSWSFSPPESWPLQ